MIQEYIQRGWKIFPVSLTWNNIKNKWNKVPTINAWNSPDTTLEQYHNSVKGYYPKGLTQGVGLYTDSVIVIDCDGEGAIHKIKEYLINDTLMCKTRTGGIHFYFKCPLDVNINTCQDVFRTKETLGWAVDIRAKDGYVVIPPTEGYEWLNSLEPQEMPKELSNLLSGYVYNKVDYREILHGVKQGTIGRMPAALSLIGMFAKVGIPKDWAYSLTLGWNKLNDPPIEEEELVEKIDYVYGKDESKQPENEYLCEPTIKELKKYQEYLRQKTLKSEPDIQTGFPKLDSMIWGLNQGELHVIMADSNVGKTIFSIWTAYFNARRNKKVLYFSTESKRSHVWDRILSAFYDIPGYKLRSGKFTQEDRKSIVTALREINKYPLVICDIPEPSFDQIKQMVNKVMPELLIIDYVQNCYYPSMSWQDQSLMAKGLRMLAREMQIPIVVTSQVNQQSYFDMKLGKRIKSDLEAGDIRGTQVWKHEADIMIMINQYFNLDTGVEGRRFDVKKARNCDKGSIYVTFDKEYVRFREIQ